MIFRKHVPVGVSCTKCAPEEESLFIETETTYPRERVPGTCLARPWAQVLRASRSSRSEVGRCREWNGVAGDLGLQELAHHWQATFLSLGWCYGTSMAYGPGMAYDPSVVCDCVGKSLVSSCGCGQLRQWPAPFCITCGWTPTVCSRTVCALQKQKPASISI